MTEMRNRHGEHTHYFPCDCGDWHYVSVFYTEEDRAEWSQLEICEAYHPKSLREKSKAAWKIFTGKEHWGNGVVLDKANVLDLKKVIDELAEYYEKENNATKDR